MSFKRNFVAFASAVWGGASGRVSITVLGVDLSGADYDWSFATSDGPTPVITLEVAAAGSQGISRTYDANIVHPLSGAVVGGTRIVPQIDENTLEGLTFSGASDLVLVHTLYETPAGGSKRVLCYGTFTVKQGAPN